MNKRSVVVVLQNDVEGWALILAASRTADRWDAFPFILTVDSGDSFFRQVSAICQVGRPLG
jgi:hypothetical protein